jgi:predicted transcriptional regulator
MAKATFVLDDQTMNAIRSLAERKRKPQSHVVREAIAIYARQEERLTDEERSRRLQVLAELMGRPPTRPQAEVDAELKDIRKSRRTGWRRSSD